VIVADVIVTAEVVIVTAAEEAAIAADKWMERIAVSQDSLSAAQRCSSIQDYSI
jgi:hypothetical protein